MLQRDSELIHQGPDLADGRLRFLFYQASRLCFENCDLLLYFGNCELGNV